MNFGSPITLGEKKTKTKILSPVSVKNKGCRRIQVFVQTKISGYKIQLDKKTSKKYGGILSCFPNKFRYFISCGDLLNFSISALLQSQFSLLFVSQGKDKCLRSWKLLRTQVFLLNNISGRANLKYFNNIKSYTRMEFTRCLNSSEK